MTRKVYFVHLGEETLLAALARALAHEALRLRGQLFKQRRLTALTVRLVEATRTRARARRARAHRSVRHDADARRPCCLIFVIEHS